MEHEVFEAWVAEALDALPEAFRSRLENVEVVIEDWPDRETLRRAGLHRPTELLGFYHGVPQTQRTRYYGLVLPDKISIYRRPIELHCRTSEEIRETIHHVVRHEIAHHFGIDDERLKTMGVY